MTLQDILRTKGSAVHTIGADATLDDVVQNLVRHNCGSLIVTAEDDADRSPRMMGIITERDILRTCAAHQGSLTELRVSEVMTRNVVTASPTDSVEDTMGLLTERRIRHLPILDGQELVGMISIGDVVKAQHHLYAVENHYLKRYIQS